MAFRRLAVRSRSAPPFWESAPPRNPSGSGRLAVSRNIGTQWVPVGLTAVRNPASAGQFLIREIRGALPPRHQFHRWGTTRPAGYFLFLGVTRILMFWLIRAFIVGVVLFPVLLVFCLLVDGTFKKPLGEVHIFLTISDIIALIRF